MNMFIADVDVIALVISGVRSLHDCIYAYIIHVCNLRNIVMDFVQMHKRM